jgi:hypothetical protein
MRGGSQEAVAVTRARHHPERRRTGESSGRPAGRAPSLPSERDGQGRQPHPAQDLSRLSNFLYTRGTFAERERALKMGRLLERQGALPWLLLCSHRRHRDPDLHVGGFAALFDCRYGERIREYRWPVTDSNGHSMGPIPEGFWMRSLAPFLWPAMAANAASIGPGSTDKVGRNKEGKAGSKRGTA